MHSVFYNYCPSSFRNVWTRNENRQLEMALRNDNQFSLPLPRTDTFKRFPLYSLPFTWNKSDELVFYENPITFRYALRDKLFNEIATATNL